MPGTLTTNCRLKRNLKHGLVAGLIAGLLCTAPLPVLASQTGIPGYSQNATGSASCHACHSVSTNAPANTITISGSTAVQAGSTNSYSLTLSAVSGQHVPYGGFDLSTSAGTLIPADSETTIINSELVHSNRKATTYTGSSHDVQWNFDWQAPAGASTITLYACGLPVNGDGRATSSLHHNTGDGRVACTTFDIQVQQKPVASAGNNQTVRDTASAVSLDGSLSYDPDGSISSYLWEKVSGSQPVTINNPGSAIAGFTPPDVPPGAPEEYIFRLTVTDNDNLSSTDTVSIFVQDPLDTNQAPVASAGADQNVNENTTVILDAGGSSDDVSISSYLWEQTGGVYTVTLNNPASALADFTAPAVDSTGDILTFQLTVTDNLGVSSTDSVSITVNDVDTPPTAKITDASGAVISAINNNATVTLYGNFSSDPEGPITAYSWSQTAGLPLINPGPANENSFSFTAPDDKGGSITIQLTVTGDKGSVQNSIRTSLQLNNLPPVVTPEPDQTVSEGETIILHGTVIDPNNNLASIQWRQINCTGSCLLQPQNIDLPLPGNDAHASVLGPAVSAGGSTLLEFELSATDSNGLTSRATTRVTVNDNGVTGFPDDAIPFTSFNGKPMAISVAGLDTGNTAVISKLVTADNASIGDSSNRPVSFPYELINLEIKPGTPGGTVMVTLYFPEAVAEGYDFYQYMSDASWVSTTKAKNFDDLNFDAARGWREIAEEAEFSADRRSVSFLLTDGGPSDTNPASGIIAIDTALGQNPLIEQEQPGATGMLSVPQLVLMWIVLCRLRRTRFNYCALKHTE